MIIFYSGIGSVKDVEREFADAKIPCMTTFYNYKAKGAPNALFQTVLDERKRKRKHAKKQGRKC